MLMLLQRARESGRCPPSMLAPPMGVGSDGFETSLINIMDHHNFHLATNAVAADAMIPILQSTNSVDNIPGPPSPMKSYALEQRRSLILTVVGATPTDAPSLSRLLTLGYLSYVKKWLDEVLSGTNGGMDFLLHLLSNVVYLPVTKAVVKNSMMGKAIGAIEKHAICVNSPNEQAIKARVQMIKDSWNNSVKLRKATIEATPISKRGLDSSIQDGPAPAKKAKIDEESKPKKGPSVSSLIKRASATAKGETSSVTSPATKARLKAINSVSAAQKLASSDTKAPPKKSAQRVKWSDHFGGQLTVASDSNVSIDTPAPEFVSDNGISWTDRKKRDRLREKELLAKAKKSKILDDDTDDIIQPAQTVTKTMTAWQQPALLPPRNDITLSQLNSAEKAVQTQRISSISAVRYFTSSDVLDNPAPMSAIEVALDLTAQSSAKTISVPFFVSQEPGSALSAVANTAPHSTVPLNTVVDNAFAPATVEFVQSLGLPLFLVGQNRKALEILAASPGLLANMVDANGAYDQSGLITLVQTLSSSQPSNHHQNSAQAFGAPASAYQQPPVPNYGMTTAYKNTSSSNSGSSETLKNGYRGHSNVDGNLHISGFGPSTTQADIINLFAPYVQVDEVVMKGNFAFVNTSDPMNAGIAKDALVGALLGGMPIRINPAQRKAKDNNLVAYGRNNAQLGSDSVKSTYGSTPGSMFSAPPIYGGVPSFPSPPIIAPPPAINTPAARSNLPPITIGKIPGVDYDVDAVRDDRGNPATKNLFVAGYGAGTTEEQIREIFSSAAHVVGVVLKGSFSFVNTSDRVQAIKARDALGGVNVNGAPLRINFAKETGRLGTSFDLTYNATSGPNALKNAPGGVPSNVPPPPSGYYGRGY